MCCVWFFVPTMSRRAGIKTIRIDMTRVMATSIMQRKKDYIINVRKANCHFKRDNIVNCSLGVHHLRLTDFLCSMTSRNHIFSSRNTFQLKKNNSNEYEREKTKKIGRKRSVYYFIKTKRMNGQKYALHMAYIWRFISKTLRNMKQRFFSKALFLHTHFLWNGLRFDVPRIVSIFTVCWMIYFTVMNRERAFYFLLHFFRACRVMRGS